MRDRALIDALAEAIATKEGFFITEEEARRRGVRWPTVAQRLCNPGNLRGWKYSDGRDYPRTGGYVDFLAAARAQHGDLPEPQLREIALSEGWQKLKRQIQIYLEGRHTNGKRPSPKEMFQRYAPSTDGNDPVGYARYVAGRLGIPVDLPFPEDWRRSDGSR